MLSDPDEVTSEGNDDEWVSEQGIEWVIKENVQKNVKT